jgi:hypothetical protein
MRLLASTKLKQIKTSSTRLNPIAKRHAYLINKINETLAKEHAILTKADNGKTIVIIYTKDYKDNVNYFLKNNNFHMIPKNPTNRFQQQLNKTLHKCNLIIQQNQIKYQTQKKPQPPTPNAQIKLHKPGKPIRPVVNNTLAPTYKIAKFLSKQPNNYLNLKNSYVVKDSITLANNLTKLKINNSHKMITLDIKDLYVNTLIKETLDITRDILLLHNEEPIATQMVTLLNTILQQNYFSFDNQIYQPHKGVTMGSPISGIIAEIFLQSFEEKHLNHILDENNTTFYTRYVDDILIVNNTDKTNPDLILKYMNSIHDDLVFTHILENEHNSINFLDLLITRQTNSIDINIYTKPTTTNTTINYLSNHPMEQKLAAYRYMINRMSSIPLSPEQQNIEWPTILDIANSNNFPEHTITKLRTTIQNPNKTSVDDIKQKK